MQEIPIASYKKAPLWSVSQHKVAKVVIGISICFGVRMDLNWRDLHAQCNRCDQWRRVSEGMQEARHKHDSTCLQYSNSVVNQGAPGRPFQASKRSRGELLIILTTVAIITSGTGSGVHDASLGSKSAATS